MGSNIPGGISGSVHITARIGTTSLHYMYSLCHFDLLHLQIVLLMASAGVLFTVLGGHIVSLLCALTDLITKHDD